MQAAIIPGYGIKSENSGQTYLTGDYKTILRMTYIPPTFLTDFPNYTIMVRIYLNNSIKESRHL